MFFSVLPTVLLATSLVQAAPLFPRPRAVTLDQAAVNEAQQRDNGATRAFTATAIKTSDGSCLSVDPLSGDFRENLTPVTTAKCNGSKNQQWDVITAGKHNNVAGQALIVSSLTNACLNFDPRRAAGNQVLLFSCGGRADGGGQVTNSQQFAFKDAKAPIQLIPLNGAGKVCITVKNGQLDQAACSASASELFTIGNGKAAAAPPPQKGQSTKAASAPPPKVTPPPTPTETKPAVPDAVSRAGGVLNPSAAAEANPVDTTAKKAFSRSQIKTGNGKCLSVNPAAGDFRQNLIPIDIKDCNAADAGQKFDFITSGKHNNVAGQTLVVSSLTNGCLNFDDRRAAGDKVILFSCGGRADGEGKVTDSQLFPFAGGKGPFTLAPSNSKNAICLTGKGAVLDAAACNASSPSADELFTIV